MNNLSSYCGLVDAEIRASDKDLPVHDIQRILLPPFFEGGAVFAKIVFA